jgi:hypothetical protein
MPATEFIREQLQGQLWGQLTDQMLYGVYCGYRTTLCPCMCSGSLMITSSVVAWRLVFCMCFAGIVIMSHGGFQW